MTPCAIRRAAVLGHPIAHSLSPVLHRAAYDELGLDWQYQAVDVTADALAEFITRLGPEWAGLSLTMPLKEAVIDLLDTVEPDAARVRAVNTVVFEGRRRHGYNTDITGLAGLLEAAGIGATSAPQTAVVIGAGATARSAVAALARSGVGRVMVAARRPDAVVGLSALAELWSMTAAPISWPPKAADLAVDVVVSTVPAEAGADLKVPETPGLLVDVIYHPWPTPLAAAWQKAGGAVVGGLELLVRQAVEQVTLMTGRRPDLELIRRAGRQALSRRSGLPEIAQADQ